ncbi:hypothetical protein AMAG_09262 [Allomyces macrogynus ATCC 38327]|uniref:Uncharacterized protein n=1 Tax=Allomyces macrogynus (strain ATCC 38327) TaxID=578462 RepID=A0A0L0SPA3_ALLM3|nr:hypothetical protein AMAG_09262 [Allomyces macrogynus ATCC 38327]|eukprot:KNE64219.1 hypothetical protein AMAG_09262 [Allomyces macrogynus ATCC 38327]
MSAAAAAALRAAYPSAPRAGATTTTKFEASRTRISKHGQTTHEHRAARTSATVQAARGATPMLVHDMQYASTRAGDVVVESGRRYYGAMPVEPRPAIAPTGTVPERGSGSSAGSRQIPIGPQYAASTTRVRAHAEAERTAEQMAYVPAPAPAQAPAAAAPASAYAKYVAQPGKVLPPVFIQCALLPSAYALTRTAPDVCEFKAVVPPPPGTPAAAAAAALARKSLARQRALAASRRPSRHVAVPSNPTSSLDTELVDELASLPGHWPGTPATPDDEELPPMHPWGSEFLLLHYRKGEKPEVVRRDMIADGLPVMLLARHGDLGLWRDRLEANPGDTAAAAEVQARLAAPDMAPQFIGVKDTGALFSIAHPTTKTIFRVARVSSKGFALRADVGAYLCVADYMLALRHDFAPAECTFRFVFVPEPLDAFWPRANMASLARQSIPRVIATTPASAAPSAATKNVYPTPSTPSNVYQAPMPAAAVAAEATAVVAEQQYQHQMQNHVRFEQQQHEHHHHQQHNQVTTTTTTRHIPITMPAAVPPAGAGETSIEVPPRNDSLTPAPQVLAAVAAAVSAQTGGPPPAPRRAGTASAAAAKAAEVGESKPSALARLCTAVAVQDCKGRYLIRERLGAWNMKPRGSHYDADDAAEDDEVDQIDVLRLSNAKTKEDERILYFEMLMLPARDKVAADSGAGMDFVDRCRTLTNNDLELAKPFDPVQGPGHRVIFKCGDKYLAVRLPPSYNPDDVTGRTSKDAQDFDDVDEDEDSRINGTLILVSRPSIATVFVYHKAQHHPLAFSLQSVPLGTYVTVNTPPAGQVVGLVHMQAAYLHARQLLLGGGRSASAAAAAASARVTALRAQARVPGKREFMTLVVPQSLAQALTTQSLKGPSKHATYLTAAITGAALLGSAAGIVNMVINANRQQAVSGSGSSSGSGTKSTFIDPTNSQGAGATTAAPTVAGADHASGAHLMAGDTAAAAGQVPVLSYDANAASSADACPTTTGDMHAGSTIDYGTRIDFPDQWQSSTTDAAQTGGSAYYLPDVPAAGYYQSVAPAAMAPSSGHDTAATIAVPCDPIVATTTTASPVYAPWPPEGPGPALPDAPRADTAVTALWPPEGPGPAAPETACFDTSAPAQDIHIADATAAQVIVPDPACGGGFHAEIHAALHAQFDAGMTAQYQHLDPSAMGVYVDAGPWDMGAHLDVHASFHGHHVDAGAGYFGAH